MKTKLYILLLILLAIMGITNAQCNLTPNLDFNYSSPH